MARIVGAVLAAGSGTRMGAPKAELVVGGVRLLDRAVLTLREAGFDPVLAIVRAGVTVRAARVIVNPQPARGMRSSLELAVDAVDAGMQVDALAVLLVDTPGLDVPALRAVADAWTAGRIAVGRYAGRRGHPTVMSPGLWRAALELAGPDEGARALLAVHAELVDEIDVAGDPTDLDTPDDLREFRP